jgi:hypothetical protein
MDTNVRRRACHGCGNAVPITLIQPRAQGAHAVDILDCPLCDHRFCKACKVPVLDRRAKSCLAGHRL